MFTKEIYQELQKAIEDLPKEAVETASKDVTRKGYDTTGYQYQYLVNVLNEVIGPTDWNLDYKILKEEVGTWGNGKQFNEVTAEVVVTILGTSRKCVGGHKSEAYADAVKGAITNGFKKTVAFFGVGKKAYEGTLDEDYRPGLDVVSRTTKPTPPQPAPKPVQATTPAPQQPGQDPAMFCPTCPGNIVRKRGKYGDFFSCTNYPSCKTTFKTLDEAQAGTNIPF